MYQPIQLARFSLAEFERGLEGLTDAEARARMTKADGTEMNAISWTVGHITRHWLQRPPELARYASGSTEPAAPPLADVRPLIGQARAFAEQWISGATDDLMLEVTTANGARGENEGTSLMRTILHTWFHTGEINAIRQMLGHKEIVFVGTMLPDLEWK